jgi:hypothetical protein
MVFDGTSVFMPGADVRTVKYGEVFVRNSVVLMRSESHGFYKYSEDLLTSSCFVVSCHCFKR